jgi:allantoin racemase
MSRIRVVVPIKGLTQEDLDRRRARLDEIKSSDTTVVFSVIRRGPASIESAWDEVQAAEGIVEACQEAEAAGDGAVIIWCAGDPALDAAREAVRIPVVGPFEAACHHAAMLGHYLGVLTILRRTIPMVHRLAARYGLARRLAAVGVVETPVLELESRGEEVFKTAVLECERMVTAGADTVVLGCMGMFDLARRLQCHFRDQGLLLPVVDPGKIAIKTAESWVALGLTHSELAFPRLPAGSSTL